MVVKRDGANLVVHWWALTLRGMAAIFFGVATVFWPKLTLETLVYLLSAFVLVSGLVGLVHALGQVNRRPTWLLGMLLAVAEIGVGVYLVQHPTVSLSTFLLVAGFLFVGRGLVEAIVALVEPVVSTAKMLTMIGAAASFLVGVLLLFQADKAGLGFVWILGVYALVTGPLLIALSLEARDALGE